MKGRGKKQKEKSNGGSEKKKRGGEERHRKEKNGVINRYLESQNKARFWGESRDLRRARIFLRGERDDCLFARA